MSKQLQFCLYTIIFFTVFNLTSALMSGLFIVSSLGGDSFISPYEVTFYGLGNACTFGLGHHFCKRFGKLHVLLTCLLLFIVANFLCSMAPNFFLFVLTRFFSGLASGSLYPVSFSLITENVTEKEKTKAFSILALLLTISPTLGAAFGGCIAYEWNWPWIFHLQGPFLLALAWIIYQHKKPFSPIEQPPFDWTGFIFYVLAIGSGVSAIALGQQLDWFRSPLICFLIGLCLVSAPFFCLWECNHENPFMDIKLYKNLQLSLALFCVFFLFSAYFGMIILLSLWLHIDVNYTPIWISFLVFIMAIAAATLFFTFRHWEEKTTSFWTVSLAILFFAISCFYSATFNAEINFGRLLIARAFAGFGLAFFLFPLLVLTIKSLSKKDSDHGLALFQSVRFLAGSLGPVVYTTIWLRRRVFYHERLGEQLTPYSELTTQALDQTALYGPTGTKALSLLEAALAKQSDALALADCFYFMGWIMILVLVIVLAYLLFHKKPEKVNSIT